MVDVFVLTNGTIDYYGFNETNGIVEAVQCTVNGTIANCNGTIIDTVSAIASIVCLRQCIG